MKQVDRTKVCLNCEADVSIQATYCPFCGTDLLTSSTESSHSQPISQDQKFSDQTLQESLASLYKPPYSVRNKQGLGIPDEREESNLQPQEDLKENPLFQSFEQMEIEDHLSQDFDSEETDEGINAMRQGNMLPLLFLMIGAHLFVLGALLLFCSKEGVVTLEWSSRFWFFYSLASLPLLYFGGRMLKSN